ncbi:LLM class flavin-dependent oxidoreductase [Amycolatopsis acidiphila]|uniref:LLM class flavin-dependent oxidoreductase n=1 Tax=Amycolatopsis acidiphila TaxID=715473 RepID=UPI0016438D3C|nr:LLM class flavin-dependent oxidoreductase [Amycolatopsis acidiphila]UIJ62499.1 LLM class flavin-dependent oxidoreductase [Amycolatopsis acidiphila]GHG83961.1 hypothetical protein GCM10017788_55600 [Amycolatopsis acidiphila]
MSTASALLCLGGEPLAEVERTWRALDEAGCDTCYVMDDFTLCAAIAARTRNTRICCLTRSHDSSRVVEAARTLQYVSGRRFVLGVGPLADDLGPFGPVTAAERLVEEVSGLVEPLPVIVFGSGAGPARLAAELAESWLTTAVPGQVQRRRVQLDELCRRLGRTRPPRCSVAVPAGHAPDAFAGAGADEVVSTLDRPLCSAEDAAAWLRSVGADDVRSA